MEKPPRGPSVAKDFVQQCRRLMKKVFPCIWSVTASRLGRVLLDQGFFYGAFFVFIFCLILSFSDALFVALLLLFTFDLVVVFCFWCLFLFLLPLFSAFIALLLGVALRRFELCHVL